jgi:hypothetical protein
VLMDGGRIVGDAPSEEILSNTGLLLEHGLELADWLRGSVPEE